MSLELIETSLRTLLASKLEWPEFEPPIQVSYFFEVHRRKYCYDDGSCYEHWYSSRLKRIEFYKPKAANANYMNVTVAKENIHSILFTTATIVLKNMALEIIEKSLIRLVHCQLKWKLSFSPISLRCDSELDNGDGFCLKQDRRGDFYRPRGFACFCKPVPCLNCKEPNPQVILDYSLGNCKLCWEYKLRNSQKYENRRTKLNCDKCLKPLPWVQDHMHQRCWLKWRLSILPTGVDDDECDCDH
jgi:hypothetical protein